MFRTPAALAAVYPNLVRHGVLNLSCPDVMRFLGRRTPAHGGVNGHFAGEAGSDLATRAEGVRVKHGSTDFGELSRVELAEVRVGANSVRMYDKRGSVLRVETTINDPGDFKGYRGTEAEPAKKQWRPLRKGVADLHGSTGLAEVRRAEASQAGNNRYPEAMASAVCPRTLGEAVGPVCRAVTRGGR